MLKQQTEKENMEQRVNSTKTITGRPKAKYTEACAATKRRIKAEAKCAVNNFFQKCKDLSKGCGQEVLNGIAK